VIGYNSNIYALVSEYESNDGFYNAQIVLTTGKIKGFINDSMDEDYYKFRSTHLFENYTVNINLSNIDANCDYNIVVYNEFEEEVGSSSKIGNMVEDLNIEIDSGMWYYIKVFSVYGTSYKPYKLEISSVNKKSSEKIYYPFTYENKKYLVPHEREINYDDDNLAYSLLNEILKDESKNKIGINTNTKLNSVKVISGTVVVDFSKEFLESKFGENDENLVIRSIVNTLTELPSVINVKFLIEGEDFLLQKPVDLSHPLEIDLSKNLVIKNVKTKVYFNGVHSPYCCLGSEIANITTINNEIEKAIIYEGCFNIEKIHR
jgi:hypothetical protein